MNRLQKISRDLLQARMSRAAMLNMLRRAKSAAINQTPQHGRINDRSSRPTS
jgi:hypothetical protein